MCYTQVRRDIMMKSLILLFLVSLEIVYAFRTGETTVNVQKEGKLIDGKWVEDAVQTIALTGKDGAKSVSKKSILNNAKSIKQKESLKKGAKPVSSSSLGQVVTSSTIVKPKESPQSKKQRQFALEALPLINKKRADHGVKPLVLNEKLQKLAFEMAKKLARKNDVNEKLPIRKDIAQAIYYKTSNQPNFQLHGTDAIKSWYLENKFHDFSKEPTPEETLKSGHFSQMVWRDTTDVGIAYVRSLDKKLAVEIAVFSPRGNWVGGFIDQVLPLQEKLADDEEVGAAAHSGECFKEEFLKWHNIYRARHNVPPLKLNDKLNKKSQIWADKLAIKDVMEHSTDDNNGENLYVAWFSDSSLKPTAKDCVSAWYNEVQFYNFKKHAFDSRTGHFTQLVWKATTEVGVGMAQNQKSKKYYVVGKYNPAGNYMKRFKKNVLPKIKSV